ncbi:ECF transporter S component [Mycoplasmopsis felis]|uniref:ECF transporter S component n=1 Tax=Mycoplasmopsis felis TaxID=33923 RepID=UPI002AF6B152|nr:ECF transporter S component [Mycoplasmopsis felis]WQQ02015.1 ECF transporter S component [Mycoplasmopsis felis]
MNYEQKEKKLWKLFSLNTFFKFFWVLILIASIFSIPNLGLITFEEKVFNIVKIINIFLISITIVFIPFLVYVSYLEYSYQKEFFINLDQKEKDNNKFKWILISNYGLLVGSLFRFLYLISLYEEDKKIYKNYKIAKKKKRFGFSTQDVAFAGILFSLFLIISLIKNFTVARVINLDFEYIFYILFAYFFGKLKGTLLSFMADFFGLLFAGRIGFYHWAYAIVPIIGTILIGLFLDLFKKHKNLSIVIMNIFLLGIFAVLIYIFTTQLNDPKGLRISRTFGLSRISLTAGIVLLTLSLVILSIFFLLVIIYFKTENKLKKEKIALLILVYFLTVSLIVLARWIWGPFAFIRYANFFLGRSYNIKDQYLILMTPIVIRSLISIPIYVFVLFSILIPLSIVKKHYTKNKLTTYY